MTDALARNPAAVALAEGLWRFFNHRLLCSPPGDDETSRIRYGITRYAPVVKARSIIPSIRLAKSDRQEEALVHELLHLELLRQGYPRFYFDKMDDKQAGLAGGIQNSADHEAMLPIFLRLGYRADRFLTPRKLSARDQRLLGEIKALPGLEIPAGYTASVSGYLRRHGFTFRLLTVSA